MSSLLRLQELITAQPEMVDASLDRLTVVQQALVIAVRENLGNVILENLSNENPIIQLLADGIGLSLEATQIAVDQACVYLESEVSSKLAQQKIVDTIRRVAKARKISMVQLADAVNLSRARLSKMMKSSRLMQCAKLSFATC